MRVDPGWIQSFFSVYAPKYVIISNVRLGILFRLTQVAAVGWVAWLAGNADPAPWKEATTPIGMGTAVWCDPVDVSQTSDSDVPHCANASAYEYIWSSTWTYVPTHCELFPGALAFKKRPHEVFIPTYIEEATVRKGVGIAGCAEVSEASCATYPGAVYTASGDTCTCTETEHFFAKLPEDLTLSLLHGYRVTRVDWFGASRIETAVTTDVQDGLWTTIHGPNAETQCSVGGRHEWSPEEASPGIHGTLREWLACGQVDLDETYAATHSVTSPSDRYPHARLTGVDLLLELHYYDRLRRGGGPVAQVRVSSTPRWSSWTEEQSSLSAGPNRNATGTRTKYQYGVSVRTVTLGHLSDTVVYRILDMLVNALVIVAVPASIMYWFILYGTGRLSDIYYKAACEELNVKKDCAGVVCRMMAAASAFRVMSRQADVPPGDVGPMAFDDVLACVAACFDDLRGKLLDDAELDNLANTIVHRLQKEGSEVITLQSYVDACAGCENMDLETVAHIFDADRKRTVIEKVFDDSGAMALSSRRLSSLSLEVGGPSPEASRQADGEKPYGCRALMTSLTGASESSNSTGRRDVERPDLGEPTTEASAFETSELDIPDDESTRDKQLLAKPLAATTSRPPSSK